MTGAALPVAISENGPGSEGSESPSPSPSASEDHDEEDNSGPSSEDSSSSGSSDEEDAADSEGSHEEDSGSDGDGSDDGSDDSGSDDEDRSGDEDGRDEDEHEDDDDEDERTVEVETSDEGVQIKLERETESSEDKIEVGFETESARFEVKFETENASASDEMKLQARFQALGEYRDDNGNGRYDAGEPILSLWTLSSESDIADLTTVPTQSIAWGSPIAAPIQSGNTSGQQITVPATFDGEGEFQLVLYVFGDFVTLNGADLKPTSVKIDVVIRDYPYVANDTALVLFVQTKMKRELESSHDSDELDDDEEGIAASQSVDGTNVSLIFAWKDFADVDGVQRPVNSTSIRLVEETEGDEWERKETFALSYARGTNITHDPEVLVSIQSAFASVLPGPMGNWLVVGAGVAIVAVGVAVTLGPRMRKP